MTKRQNLKKGIYSIKTKDVHLLSIKWSAANTGQVNIAARKKKRNKAATRLCWIAWTLVDKEELPVCCAPPNAMITARNEARDTVKQWSKRNGRGKLFFFLNQTTAVTTDL